MKRLTLQDWLRVATSTEDRVTYNPVHGQGQPFFQMGVPRSRSFDVAVRGREG